jgi:hypothetical protein
LSEEQLRVDKYLSSETGPVIRKIIQDEMLKAHLEEIITVSIYIYIRLIIMNDIYIWL